MTPLEVLDRLTDAEADNLRQAQRQGDLDDSVTLTWAVVLDSWLQYPEEFEAHSGQSAAEIDRALLHVIARYGLQGDVMEAYVRDSTRVLDITRTPECGE